MASTYSALGHIELPAPGEQRDLWGTIINRSLTLIEDMIAGITEISTNGSSTYIVSEVMGNTDTSRNGILLCNGALIQDLTVQVPNVSHIYHVRNQTTGPFVVKVKTPSGTAVTIPQNCAAIIHVDDAANSDSILFLSAIVSMTTGDPVGDSTLPDGDYGDITITGGGAALTIDPGVVSNAKLATMAASSLKGNATGGVAAPTDLTVAQVKTLLAYTAADVGAQPLDADLTIWAGITPSANAQSLVGAADYAAMRALLDLEPGTDFLSPAAIAAAYQPLSANLTTWAGVASSANGRSLVSAADYAAMRALLDLEVGTDFLSPAAVTAAISAYAQPLDADLTTWAGISPSANAQSLVGAASYAAMRALLDLEAGTDFLSPAAIAAAYQPLDSDLTSIAALTTTAYGRALLEVANAAALTALSNAFVGDSGAGGTKGMVPAPAAGDAAANKYLKANGSWVALPGGGDLLSTNNLSDLTNAATARTNLGLAIGVNVQAYDADLTTWAGLPPSANAQSLVTAADYSAMRTLLGLVIGTNVQAYDADLTTWAGITPAANVGTFLATPTSANLKTAVTDETGTGGALVFATNPTITDLDLAAGSTTVAPLNFTSGTNLTTAVAGACEYDGKVAYFTPQSTERGINQSPQFFRLNANLAGSNATGAQSTFGKSVSLSASTVYAFRMVYTLQKTAGTTSHTVSIGFGGTATLNNIMMGIDYNNAAVVATNAVASFRFTKTTAALQALSAAITTADNHWRTIVTGTVSINAAGTFIPQYSLSAAPGGAYSTLAGSYMEIWPIGASGANINVGTWA